MARKKQFRTCTEVVAFDKDEAKDLAAFENPANVSLDVDNPLRGIVLKDKLWSPGRTLRVRFLDGDPVVQQKVTAVAQKWLEVVNLKFDFGNHTNAEIRISFRAAGSWSYIGTDALTIKDPKQPTMNFGWLTPRSAAQEYNRVVLHEFGHALGMGHEHLNPVEGIPWNEPAVIEFYRKTNNWDEATTRLNVLNKYREDQIIATVFDANSIMLYPVPAELTLNGFAIPWSNSQLSPKDREFMAQKYPKP
jgi:serralysin